MIDIIGTSWGQCKHKSSLSNRQKGDRNRRLIVCRRLVASIIVWIMRIHDIECKSPFASYRYSIEKDNCTSFLLCAENLFNQLTIFVNFLTQMLLHLSRDIGSCQPF